MSDPIEDDLDSEAIPGLLRRQDQQLLAGLAVVAGICVCCWWWRSGGPSGRLIEWNQAPSQSARFEVNVNTASWPELAQLPEIGETFARRIVENRRTEGPFRSPEDLTRVHGIGEKTLEQMRPYLSDSSWADAACQVAPSAP